IANRRLTTMPRVRLFAPGPSRSAAFTIEGCKRPTSSSGNSEEPAQTNAPRPMTMTLKRQELVNLMVNCPFWCGRAHPMKDVGLNGDRDDRPPGAIRFDVPQVSRRAR